MKYDEFRDFKIERTCNKEYKHYKSYKKFLRKDFHYRCAYCNSWDFVIEPLGFAIDHYVPRKTFKNIDKTFSNNYNNLMYVCPKCNREKSDKFKGNIDKLEIKNELFYNPVEKDYNQIFFRNEFGGIDSEDEKAREMMKELKLYRPLYNFAWLLEKLINTRDKIKSKINENNISLEKKEMLEKCLAKINDYYIDMEKLFKKSYKMK